MTFTEKVDLLLEHLNDMPFHRDMFNSFDTPTGCQGIVAYKPEDADIGIRYDGEYDGSSHVFNSVELVIGKDFSTVQSGDVVCSSDYYTYLYVERLIKGTHGSSRSESRSYRWCVGDDETVCTSSEAEPVSDEWGGLEFDIDTPANYT
ncbi:hypothetical protein EKG38_14030 [Shewanella canadensis]|uniref:Uncharacterized protein n=1 Tax=Shewanella canadensis TaxID=271096 RepID=A0A431WSE9_9GAMM|nr:hypothetical protein [Shewanella canadensis]RTR38618.1 hypothetical protein EKG38_14030 [Shewanella canadensis]